MRIVATFPASPGEKERGRRRIGEKLKGWEENP